MRKSTAIGGLTLWAEEERMRKQQPGCERLGVNPDLQPGKTRSQLARQSDTAVLAGHESGKPFRAGVGIPGMIARMQQFGGDLHIHSGANGTAVHAIVPIG